MDIGGDHGCIGTDHVAHETANAPRFVLDDKIPWPHLEGLSDTGVYTGRLFALFTKTENRPFRTEEGLDVGEYLGGREGSIFFAGIAACLFALATEVTEFRLEIERFHLKIGQPFTASVRDWNLSLTSSFYILRKNPCQ
jgi:hypothetical protein